MGYGENRDFRELTNVSRNGIRKENTEFRAHGVHGGRLGKTGPVREGRGAALRPGKEYFVIETQRLRVGLEVVSSSLR